MTLVLNIPPDAEAALRNAWGAALDRAAFEALVIEGYRTRKLGLGVVRQLLGLSSRPETEQWLGARGVHAQYSADDLADDRRTLDRLLGNAA